MSSLDEGIRMATAEHTRLLSQLREIDAAPRAFQYHLAQIVDLDNGISNINKDIAALKAKRQAYEKARRSIFRKSSYTLSGRSKLYATKMETEEHDYLEVTQALKEAEARSETLIEKREIATVAEKTLKPAKDRYDRIREQLDVLYSSLFDGPTPEYPQEDMQEQEVDAAATRLKQTKQAAELERQVVVQLTEAQRCMEICLSRITSGSNYATLNLFTGSAYASLGAKGSMNEAQSAFINVKQRLLAAQRLQSQVQGIGGGEINGPSTLQLIFNNMFTGVAVLGNIYASRTDMESCASALGIETHKAEVRLQEILLEIPVAETKLHEAQDELRRVRGRILELFADS